MTETASHPEIETVGVVGCGLMGSGIVEVCARSGLDVVVREINQEVLHQGLSRIRSSLDRGLSRGKLSEEEHSAALDRVRGTTEFDDFAGCDVVIEAVIEDIDLNSEVFAALDRVVPDTAF